MDGLLDAIPPRLLAEWRAFHLLRPWDAANTAALAGSDFRPDWLEDLVEVADERATKEAKRNPAPVSGRTWARKRLHGKKGSYLGWTWP